MVNNAQLWQRTLQPKPVPIAKKPPPPISPQREVPVQLVHQEGAALQTIQSVFPQPPKASSNLAASAPPTVQLQNARLAVPLPDPMPWTMPIAISPPVVDLPMVAFQGLPLAVAHPPPTTPPVQPVPPPIQPVPPPVQPRVHAKPAGKRPQPPPPLPIGISLNNGVLSCQHHWGLLTKTQGRNVCLLCDYCYDQQHHRCNHRPMAFDRLACMYVCMYANVSRILLRLSDCVVDTEND